MAAKAVNFLDGKLELASIVVPDIEQKIRLSSKHGFVQGGSFVSNSTRHERWEVALTSLAAHVPPESFRSTFAQVQLLDWNDSSVRIGVPNRFVRIWIETHYMALLERTVAEIEGKPRRIQLVIQPELFREQRRRQRAATPGASDPTVGEAMRIHLALPAQGEAAAPLPLPGPGDPAGGFVFLHYRLQDFVVGPSNALAHAAAQAVINLAGGAYNPLLVYGATGLGKTHLLISIYNGLLEHQPSLKVLYLSGDDFTGTFVRALRDKKLEAFRSRFQQCDVLLFDDVHLLGPREKTQEEFLHLFDRLYRAGKQLVVASGVHPRQVEELSERLVTRLVSGLPVEIQPPMCAMRREILARKAAARSLRLPAEVLDFLAERLELSVRELEGVVNRMAALSFTEKKPVDLELASSSLKALGLLRQGPPSREEILAAVEKHFGIPAPELRSAKRGATTALARQVAMYLTKELTAHSLSEIGQFYGDRAHGTVHYAVRKITEQMEKDPELGRVVRQLRHRLKN